MRAVSTKISPETGAGGFILPDDRVDVLLTRTTRGSNTASSTRTFLKNVRVLAIGQTYRETEDNTKVVIGKTATLELTPGQAEALMQNEAMGTISLSLRSLTDSGPNAVASNSNYGGSLRVFRYGKESSISVGSSQ